MTQPEQSWDIALSRSGPADKQAGAYFIPMAIFRQLSEKGMWRAKLTLSPDGILISPYVADGGRKRPKQETVELPF